MNPFESRIRAVVAGGLMVAFFAAGILWYSSEVVEFVDVPLASGWSEVTKDGEPMTFMRSAGGSGGVLQITRGEFPTGKLDSVEASNLERRSIELGLLRTGAKLIESSNGRCAFGRYGTATVQVGAEFRMQLWHLSDGQDLILATFTSGIPGDPVEWREATESVGTLTVGSKRKWPIF